MTFKKVSGIALVVIVVITAGIWGWTHRESKPEVLGIADETEAPQEDATPSAAVSDVPSPTNTSSPTKKATATPQPTKTPNQVTTPKPTATPTINPEINPQTYFMKITSKGFTTSVNVRVGDSIMWSNQDNTDHKVVADDGSFSSDPLSKGETYTHPFTKKGTFTYHCGLSSSMKGTVIVK